MPDWNVQTPVSSIRPTAAIPPNNGVVLPWASWTLTLPITYSGGNVITNGVANKWALDRTGTDSTGFSTSASVSFVTVPVGTYIWTLELWGNDNWDGIITYTTTPTDGTACANIHTEVQGNAATSFDKIQYYDEPVFKGITGGALVRTGTTSVTRASASWIYVDTVFEKVPWLTTSNASGTVKGHFTAVRIDGAPL